jgi:hypothetical protein
MRVGVLWTNLSLRELSRRLLALGTPASRRTIRRLLRKLKVGRRTARKKKTMGQHPDRNAQFENIGRLRREYQGAGDPVISIDTKKKELLGNFHRAGATYTERTVETFDHDFGSAGQGKLIPHGIYDLANEHAHIHLNRKVPGRQTVLRTRCLQAGRQRIRTCRPVCRLGGRHARQRMRNTGPGTL